MAVFVFCFGLVWFAWTLVGLCLLTHLEHWRVVALCGIQIFWFRLRPQRKHMQRLLCVYVGLMSC